MNEQVITIKEIAEKPGKKGPYKIVTSSSGAKYYAFDPETFDSLKTGASAKLTVEQQGDYTHIKGVVIEGPRPTLQELSQPLQAKPAAIAPPAASNARDASIEAQVAVKAVSEMVSNGKLDINGKAGQYALAWCIIKLREALPPVAVEAIDIRVKELSKPKAKD
jgi:hypothetical protein